MGGAKKKSLAQMEKQQKIKEEETKKAAKKAKASVEKKTGAINLPDLSSKEFLGELSKMRAVTPYGLASRFGLRFSVAKDVLEELEKRGVVQLIAGSNRLRIYRAVAA